MTISFEYCGDIPPNLKELTDILIGYSCITDFPIYEITFNIDNKILNDLLFTMSEIDYIDKINLFIRNYKINYFCDNKNNDMSKLVEFLQIYMDDFFNIYIKDNNKIIKKRYKK